MATVTPRIAACAGGVDELLPAAASPAPQRRNSECSTSCQNYAAILLTEFGLANY